MPKQTTPLRYVAKIHSSRFKKGKWKLEASLDELRKTGELVALGNSQMLDWIDEIRGNTNQDRAAIELRQRIRALGSEPASVANRATLKALRKQLTTMMYKEDYLLIIMDTKKDFEKLCTEGLTFNGNRMSFLLGTTGGVKTSTMIFTKVDIFDALVDRLNNGRNMERQFIPAKLEAYMALACSGSVAVSPPNGVLVVDDCVTHFTEDAIHIKDGDGLEPEMTFEKDADIELTDSDGYGLMCPELSMRWGRELGEGGMVTGVNTRCAFEKGMAFTFDFRRFAKEVAHKEIVTDVWGHDRNVDDVELILTTSMLKLWDSYSSWEDYWDNCAKHHYTFRVTKVCPQELESVRTTNYQFIQPYQWTDEQLREFIKPTISNIRDAMTGDWAKTILYIKGAGLSKDKLADMAPDWTKAVMIDRRMMDDPYVKSRIHNMVKRRIEDAAIGVIDVEGNYSIISGDPYSLCQHVFGLEVTGLLKAGECYHRQWADKRVPEIVVFRAPMSCGNNIRTLYVADTDEQRDWYQYMNTCTILNSWDATCHALNGADKDSDAVLSTNNIWLLDFAPRLPVIMCEQKSARKRLVEWSDFVASNIAAAGDDIGAITNRCTAMYDKLTQVTAPEQKEALEYRIRTSQHYQQNAIDKAKGIECVPMNPEWYDMRALRIGEDDTQEDIARKEFNRTIAVNRKPYFMRYVYQDVMSDWSKFVQKAEDNCLRTYRMTVAELRELVDAGEGSAAQQEFIANFDKFLPVSDGDCVVNRICHIIEEEFRLKKPRDMAFDPAILKSNTPYDEQKLKMLMNVCKEYTADTQRLIATCKNENVDALEVTQRRAFLTDYYKERCAEVCSNAAQLCDMMVDIGYRANTGKQFVWDVCAEQLIANLLANTGGKIHCPVPASDGEIVHHGKQYTMKEWDVTEC